MDFKEEVKQLMLFPATIQAQRICFIPFPISPLEADAIRNGEVECLSCGKFHTSNVETRKEKRQ
jgi:hypothetical protein